MYQYMDKANVYLPCPCVGWSSVLQWVNWDPLGHRISSPHSTSVQWVWVGTPPVREVLYMVPPLISSSLTWWWWSPAMIHRLCSVLSNPMSAIRVKEGGVSTVAGDNSWYALCWDSLRLHKGWIEGWHLANQDTSPNFIYSHIYFPFG